MATGRNAEARNTLLKISQVNGRPVSVSLLPSDQHAKAVTAAGKEAKDETMLDLLKIPRLRIQFFIISYAWLVRYTVNMTVQQKVQNQNARMSLKF